MHAKLKRLFCTSFCLFDDCQGECRDGVARPLSAKASADAESLAWAVLAWPDLTPDSLKTRLAQGSVGSILGSDWSVRRTS
ncbi:hypothetical protein CEP54_008287 [Fusarium duplospermum]|uniref:Uncharacterized protein n=1 Tax=Fusarium duplospermum TaxID=1325734 RepID=A0A428PWT9_9HYPO|nr:hypothetical protein CEP54_008287 [Fusarium duplospermum]